MIYKKENTFTILSKTINTRGIEEELVKALPGKRRRKFWEQPKQNSITMKQARNGGN